LNSKIRVPRLLVTVRVFCRLETASKCTQTYFGDKKLVFRGGDPAISTTHPLDAYGASPSLLKS